MAAVVAASETAAMVLADATEADSVEVSREVAPSGMATVAAVAAAAALAAAVAQKCRAVYGLPWPSIRSRIS